MRPCRPEKELSVFGRQRPGASLTWIKARPLALLPGQAFVPPARGVVALVTRVERSLEAVRDVVDAREAVTLELLARLLRAVAAAADEHDRAHRVVGAGQLLHLPNEVRIDLPVRTVVPRNVQRPHRVADEEVLHLAPAVDEQRIGILLQEFQRLLGLEVLHCAYYRASSPSARASSTVTRSRPSSTQPRLSNWRSSRLTISRTLPSSSASFCCVAAITGPRCTRSCASRASRRRNATSSTSCITCARRSPYMPNTKRRNGSCLSKSSSKSAAGMLRSVTSVSATPEAA